MKHLDHATPPPLSLVALSALLSVACRPELPHRSRPSADGATDSLAVLTEPDAPLDALPQALRLRIRPPEGVELSPDDVYLASGTLGAPSLRALERGEPSLALEARLVELSRWREGPDIVLAPRRWLPAGERFALALPTLGVSLRLDTAELPPPRLERVFPPEESSSTHFVYCGELELPELDVELELSPSATPARLSRGTSRGLARRCLSLDRLGATEAALPPPAIELDGAIWSLDPRPLEAGAAELEGVEALLCEPDELRFGPGCARVEDDRLRLRSPEQPVFWAVSAAALDVHFVTQAGAVTTMRGLAPSSRQVVELEWLDLAGAWRAASVALETGAPRAHFVLSEVYADALGPEPQQEWVEILNDGLAGGSLAAHLLYDVGAATELPDAWLAPGEHALVVEEAFDPSGAWDLPPATGTQLVRVPKLGKSGLSNQGEPLRLEDGEGRVLSHFPAAPKPKPGISVARRHPAADDGDPASFVRADRGPTPGRPNEGSFAD